LAGDLYVIDTVVSFDRAVMTDVTFASLKSTYNYGCSPAGYVGICEGVIRDAEIAPVAAEALRFNNDHFEKVTIAGGPQVTGHSLDRCAKLWLLSDRRACYTDAIEVESKSDQLELEPAGKCRLQKVPVLTPMQRFKEFVKKVTDTQRGEPGDIKKTIPDAAFEKLKKAYGNSGALDRVISAILIINGDGRSIDDSSTVRYRPATMIICLSTEGGHNYEVGSPVLSTGTSDRQALKRKAGSVLLGNHHSGTPDNTRLATNEEIEKYFDGLDDAKASLVFAKYLPEQFVPAALGQAVDAMTEPVIED
jgi:hypothetical protein